jgi:hypothetical protein
LHFLRHRKNTREISRKGSLPFGAGQNHSLSCMRLDAYLIGLWGLRG